MKKVIALLVAAVLVLTVFAACGKKANPEETTAAEVVENPGDVDETEQLQYVLNEAKKQHIVLTSVQIQLIMDGEKEYGIEQGYYEDIDY